MSTALLPVSARRSARWVQSGAYVLVIASLTFVAASGARGWAQVGFTVLAVLGVATALVRQRYPYALLGVAWIMSVFATQVLLIPALFNLGVRRKDWRSHSAALLTCVLLAAVSAHGERLVSVDGVDLEAWAGVASWLLNSIVVALVPYLIGTAVSARRDLTESYRLRAEHAEAERAARAAEAILRERARIAREAHDVLGHKLSLLSLQAGGLELNSHARPQVIEYHARLISQSARDALDDLRFIIDSIEPRESRDSATRSLISQDARDIERLIRESRLSGAIVGFDTPELFSTQALPEKTARAAFRIVQECLTNAHRHAPGAPVNVSLAGAPGQHLVIEVRNAVADSVNTPKRQMIRGRGLPGIAERARLVGGELTITESHSVFVAQATLPWPASEHE